MESPKAALQIWSLGPVLLQVVNRILLKEMTGQVVQLVSRCGEQSGEPIQLAVLRALLTIATAEHFIVHGDCLMQVVCI